MSADNSRRDSGFTVLEMLATLLLVAVIATSIAGGLRLGQRAWEHDRSDEDQAGVDSAARALKMLLEHATPAVAIDPLSKRPALVFVGEPHGLAFVALSEGKTQFAGLSLARIGLSVGAANKPDLHLQSSVYRAETAWAEGRDSAAGVLIVSGVARFDLSYFGADESSTRPVWRDEWIGRTRLPQLIALTLIVARGGLNDSATLTVLLRQS